MSFPRYASYKPSGVEWLGQVPEHWRVVPIRKAAMLASGHTPSRSNPDYWKDCDVPWFTLGDIWQVRELRKTYITETSEKISQLGLANSSAQLLPKGTVMLSRTASVGFSAIMGVDMATTQDFANWVCGSDLLPEFLLYALRSMRTEFERLMMGSTHNTIYMPDIAALKFAQPSATEQHAIVAFLDRETAKIDALVEEQKRLVELLKEKRQAVVSHAVTKGLDPNAPMKDSGIEWIGEVPEHWEVTRVKFITRSVEQGWSPQCESRPAQAGEWAVLKVGCVNGGNFDPTENKALPADLDPIPSLSVMSGDLLISRANTRELVGGAAVAHTDYPRLMICDKLYRLRLDGSRCSSPFLGLLLGTEAARGQIELSATGASSSMLNIGQSTVLDMPLVVPPPPEQDNILTYLQREDGTTDELEQAVGRAMALLAERRAALISAAVTGKIDVRKTATRPRIFENRDRVRLVVAAELIERLSHKSNFGRVKFQKLVYLSEAHVGVRELDGDYLREAAGPYDRNLIMQMEGQLHKAGHASVEQRDGSGGQVTYRLLGRPGTFSDELRTLLGDRRRKFELLIDRLGDFDTKRLEAVATLYAVWNDALLDGNSPTDEQIISEVLSEWHPEKRLKFTQLQLRNFLRFMRESEIVPHGQEPRTRLGRLFA